MTTNLNVGALFEIPARGRFPDIELPNQDKELIRLSNLTQPSLMDRYIGFTDGYPLILVFYTRLFLSPRPLAGICEAARQQLPQLVQFQSELAVNYGKLITVSVDPPIVQAAFRAGLGAQWHFLSDENRELIKQINILDETGGD
ncbi:redoxin domain-containing protein [Phormidesmis sp. 146-12]